MINDIKIIKKHFGEETAHFCSKNFSKILEHRGVLSTILKNHFANNKTLIQDIQAQELESDEL